MERKFRNVLIGGASLSVIGLASAGIYVSIQHRNEAASRIFDASRPTFSLDNLGDKGDDIVAPENGTSTEIVYPALAEAKAALKRIDASIAQNADQAQYVAILNQVKPQLQTAINLFETTWNFRNHPAVFEDAPKEFRRLFDDMVAESEYVEAILGTPIADLIPEAQQEVLVPEAIYAA